MESGELGPAPRDCGCPGCTTLQVHAAPQPWKQFAPSSHKLRHWLVSEQVCSRFPGRVPADRPGAPPLVPPLLGSDPRLSFPSPEKPPIYRSFLTRSFLLRRTLASLPPRDPHLGSVSRPSPSFRRPPFTLSSPPGDPQFHTPLPQTLACSTRLPSAEEPQLQSRGQGVGLGEPPHFRHLVLGTPLTSAVRDVFTEGIIASFAGAARSGI